MVSPAKPKIPRDGDRSQSASGVGRVLLGFGCSLAYVYLMEVLRRWFHWRADLDLVNFAALGPIVIFLLCVRTVPKWLHRGEGRKEAAVARFMWCIILGLGSWPVLYILDGLLLRHVLPVPNYFPRL
jgi:hypothetical protein